MQQFWLDAAYNERMVYHLSYKSITLNSEPYQLLKFNKC